MRNDKRNSPEMGTGSPNSIVRDTELLSFPTKSGRRQAKFPALLTQNCRSGKRPNADIGQYQVQRSPQDQSVPPTRSLCPSSSPLVELPNSAFY